MLNRPRVICHMATSLDGRIVVDGWPEEVAAAVRSQYEEIHASYGAQGWICGRVTMEPFAGGMRSDEAVGDQYRGGIDRDDFIAPGEHESFAFAVDPRGRLAWQSSDISGDHVVAILTHRVSDTYLEHLRDLGMSYLLAGSGESDLSLALQKIALRFGIQGLMLEGGGAINGAMLAANLVDELSVLVAPVVDGRSGTPALFDMVPGSDTARLELQSVEQREGGVLWLRYGSARS
jgi:2,5-diamino-6-(ribosylamino)-4(3H)-pyrimidinone 5'-phosphate reductase